MHDAASGVVPYHAHQFDDAEQQYQTSTLGMWLFLGQEVLFFGAVFATYFYYFYMYPDAFEAASNHMSLTLGAFNTVVLIGSSLTIPITDGRLNLGTWQGIYLCEHRNRARGRRLVITVWGEVEK